MHTDTDGYAYGHVKGTLAARGEGVKCEISLFLGIPEKKKVMLDKAYKKNDGAYLLEVSEKDGKIALYGNTHRGLIYAAATLRALIEAGKLSSLALFDYPEKKIESITYEPIKDVTVITY